jgi:hypothetical protein
MCQKPTVREGLIPCRALPNGRASDRGSQGRLLFAELFANIMSALCQTVALVPRPLHAKPSLSIISLPARPR